MSKVALRTSARKPIKKPVSIRANKLFGECDRIEFRNKTKLPKNFNVLNLNPNIYLLEGFLTKTELKHLIEVGIKLLIVMWLLSFTIRYVI